MTNDADVILMSDTKTLRKLLLKHKENPKVFDEAAVFGRAGEWHRISPKTVNLERMKP